MEFKAADTEEQLSDKVNEALRQMAEFTKRGYSVYGNMVLLFVVKMKKINQN